MFRIPYFLFFSINNVFLAHLLTRCSRCSTDVGEIADTSGTTRDDKWLARARARENGGKISGPFIVSCLLFIIHASIILPLYFEYLPISLILLNYLINLRPSQLKKLIFERNENRGHHFSSPPWLVKYCHHDNEVVLGGHLVFFQVLLSF